MCRIAMACVSLFTVTTAPALAQDASGQPLRSSDAWIYSQMVGIAGKSQYSAFVQFSVAPFTAHGGESVISRVVGSTKEELYEKIRKHHPATLRRESINPDFCVIDLFDTVSLTNRPCTSPLVIGDVWSVERDTVAGHEKSDYKVTGFEEVEVPVGTFKAMKIENIRYQEESFGSNQEQNVSASNGNARGKDDFDRLIQSLTGKENKHISQNENLIPSNSSHAESMNSMRQHVVYWYAPGIKSYVKRYVDYMDISGVHLFEETDELVEFSVKN